jgi:serine/threonine protein kinase
MGNQSSPRKTTYFSKDEQKYYKGMLERERFGQHERPPWKPAKLKELSGCLGRGNSEVKKVVDLETGQIMAVKLLKCAYNDIGSFSSLEQEDKILAELNHKNIVKFYGAVVDQDFLKIYMEFVDGGSIYSLLKSTGPLSHQVVANFTRQICEGLEYLHSHSIIHRDIKCANVLVDRHGNVRLTDFGSAKELCSVAESYFGTSGWIAPEVS